MTEIREKSHSEVKITTYINSLPIGEKISLSVPQLSRKLRLAPTTIKWRLEILRVLGVIEVDTHDKKRPKLTRIK
ncbi:MAG: hypothetical protein EOM29_09990 [Bacteroidia bacterium]|nr:hypothetical protein [Bacteroidia bacterium]